MIMEKFVVPLSHDGDNESVLVNTAMKGCLS